MSLRAPIVYCLPDDTAQVARAAFPRGNTYLRVYDALGPVYSNPQFAALFPKEGQPAVAPAQLALATIFQAVTAAVQARLAARGLTPREHLADTSYVTAAHLVTSQTEHDCTLRGPIHEDYSWQARAGEGFGAAQFTIEWEQERAICPQGRASRSGKPTRDGAGHDIINIRFAYGDCRDCPARQRCVSSDRARARQHTPEFREQYHARAGSEGTFSQGVGLGDRRRTRYRGLAKTRLRHLLIATASTSCAWRPGSRSAPAPTPAPPPSPPSHWLAANRSLAAGVRQQHHASGVYGLQAG